MKRSAKQKLATEYGRTVYIIRGACANLSEAQRRVGKEFVKVEDLQASLEGEAKSNYEHDKGALE